MRRENPYGIIFANLGAHHSVENAKRAVDLLEANAIQIHVNAPRRLSCLRETVTLLCG